MTMNSLNRTVLASLIGAALAGGLAVPQSAHARGWQDQEQSAQEREDAREAKRKERESAAAARETARAEAARAGAAQDRKSTRLNSSHLGISYAVFCLKKKKNSKKERIA